MNYIIIDGMAKDKKEILIEERIRQLAIDKLIEEKKIDVSGGLTNLGKNELEGIIKNKAIIPKDLGFQI